MNKRKLIIILSSFILFLILALSIYSYMYNKYYKIDTAQFGFAFFARAAISPDEQHNIHLTIYRAQRESDISYIMGILNFADIDHLGQWQRDSRIIFWQRVDTSSLETKVIDDLILDDWIDLDWIDNDTAVINGIVVNINTGFDYRRD